MRVSRFSPQGDFGADAAAVKTLSTQVVSTSPEMKSGCRKILLWSEIVVWTPSITNSSSARRIVDRASRRVGAWTINFPSKES